MTHYLKQADKLALLEKIKAHEDYTIDIDGSLFEIRYNDILKMWRVSGHVDGFIFGYHFDRYVNDSIFIRLYLGNEQIGYF